MNPKKAKRYEPKTKFAKDLWYAYAELGEHVTWCDECLEEPFCKRGDRFFQRVLKVLQSVPISRPRPFPKRLIFRAPDR